MALMTQEELAACCAVWQKRLRLQDWEVRVRVAERGSLSPLDAYGTVNFDRHHKSAHIAVVVSADLAEHDPLYCPERTLTHELLHLTLCSWVTDEGSGEAVAQEQAINAIARALVQLARAE